MFYIYILYSSNIDKYYIGFTEDLNDRIYKHNNKHRGFTASANDWELKYSEEFNTKQEAIKREKEIKNWKSRVMIEKLINNHKY